MAAAANIDPRHRKALKQLVARRATLGPDPKPGAATIGAGRPEPQTTTVLPSDGSTHALSDS